MMSLPSQSSTATITDQVDVNPETVINQKGADIVSETIERLKIEAEDARLEYSEMGAIAGSAWVRTASYKDLLYAAEHFDPSDCPKGDAVLGDYFAECTADDALLSIDNPSTLVNAWVGGWVERVSDFYSEIQSQVSA